MRRVREHLPAHSVVEVRFEGARRDRVVVTARESVRERKIFERRYEVA